MKPKYRILLLFLAFFLVGCNSYFYWPEPRPPIPDSSFARGVEIHHFTSKDGTILQGWFCPSGSEFSEGLVVYCHGADTNIGEYYEAVEFLPRSGFDLFMFDYRGYGASEGKPTRDGTLSDTHAAIDYAKSLPDRPKPTVALFGFSLGAGIAVVTASERNDVIGVVAQSGFDEYRGIGKKVAGDSWKTWALSFLAPVLISRGWDPVDYADKLSPRPYFILHGHKDILVPYEMAERLYARAKEPKKLWIMSDTGHYSPPGERHPQYERRVVGYLKYMFALAEGKEPTVDPDCCPGGAMYD
jgi:hypothetical protein